MRRWPDKSSPAALFKIAEGQQGYFTAKQAVTAGYMLGSQAHHVRAANWVRVERGIYRLARFPRSPDEQLVIYSLWTRNRAGEPEGVYSHHTALSILELSDLPAARLHITVPPTFRRTAIVPPSLVLHRAVLKAGDIEQRLGFAVTRPLRTLADMAAAEPAPRVLFEAALAKAQHRGVITIREIAELRGRDRPVEWFVERLAANEDAHGQAAPMTGTIARKAMQYLQPPHTSAGLLEHLSARQQEVLDLLAHGFLYKEIAESLRLSLPTVNTYVRRIYERLHVRSRTNAVAMYLKQPPGAALAQPVP